MEVDICSKQNIKFMHFVIDVKVFTICMLVHSCWMLDLHRKKTVADTFAGKELPPNIAALTNTKFICPNTKRFTLQEDNNQIFFVPFSETDQGAIGSRDRGNKKSNSLFRIFSHEYSSNDPPDAVKVQSHGLSKGPY